MVFIYCEELRYIYIYLVIYQYIYIDKDKQNNGKRCPLCQDISFNNCCQQLLKLIFWLNGNSNSINGDEDLSIMKSFSPGIIWDPGFWSLLHQPTGHHHLRVLRVQRVLLFPHSSSCYHRKTTRWTFSQYLWHLGYSKRVSGERTTRQLSGVYHLVAVAGAIILGKFYSCELLAFLCKKGYPLVKFTCTRSSNELQFGAQSVSFANDHQVDLPR